MIRSAATRSTSASPYFVALWFTLLTAIGGVWAYYRIFTGFSIWDDEGSLMLSVKQYLSGLKLYDQVWSGYGPVYYFYNWLIRSTSGTPVTHDVVRISSLFPWLLTALVCAWIVLRFTGSIVLGSLVHLLTLYSLQFFAQEPGHPQELCILLLVCLVACGALLEGRMHLLGIILLGALPAALLLIKVNIGVFAIFATGLALSFHASGNYLVRTARVCFVTAGLLLPFVLMRHQLSDIRTSVYCLLITASMAALSLILFGSEKTLSVSFRDCAIVSISFVITFVAVLLVLLAQGSSLHAMLNSLVLLHLRVSVSGSWYVPANLSQKWIPWILSGTGAVCLVMFGAFSKKNGRNLLSEFLFPFKLVFGLCLFAAIFSTNHSHLLAFATPYCWLPLYPFSESGTLRLVFPRTLLCTAATIQALYAYPIAGSQIFFVQILLIVVGVVCIGDFLLWFSGKYSTELRQYRLPLRLLRPVLLLCLALDYVYIGYIQSKDYKSLPALYLAGASRIHLPGRQARDYQWLTQTALQYCDIFIGLPNIPSLNLWTAMSPPALLNSDAWTLVLTDKEQIEVASALSTHPNACVIYNPEVLSIWDRDHHDISGLPLVSYIHDNFKPVGSMDKYVFLVRNGRDLAKIPDSSL